MPYNYDLRRAWYVFETVNGYYVQWGEEQYSRDIKKACFLRINEAPDLKGNALVSAIVRDHFGYRGNLNDCSVTRVYLGRIPKSPTGDVEIVRVGKTTKYE